jgi:hypothetical protein
MRDMIDLAAEGQNAPPTAAELAEVSDAALLAIAARLAARPRNQRNDGGTNGRVC